MGERHDPEWEKDWYDALDLTHPGEVPPLERVETCLAHTQGVYCTRVAGHGGLHAFEWGDRFLRPAADSTVESDRRVEP